MYSPPLDPETERRMRARHARAAKALDVQTEPGGEFWGWAGRTLGAPARTAAGEPAWLRLVSVPEDKASGKLWDGALDAQDAFGDLDGHRPALLAVHDAVDDGTAYRAELSSRVDQPVLSDDRSSFTASSCRTPGGTTWPGRCRKWRPSAPTVSPSGSSTWSGPSPSSWASPPRPSPAGPQPMRMCTGRTSRRRCGCWTGRAGAALRRGSTPPLSTPTPCFSRTPPPASAPSSPCWAARPASPPKRPCAPNCSRPWPAGTTSLSPPRSGLGRGTAPSLTGCPDSRGTSESMSPATPCDRRAGDLPLWH